MFYLLFSMVQKYEIGTWPINNCSHIVYFYLLFIIFVAKFRKNIHIFQSSTSLLPYRKCYTIGNMKDNTTTILSINGSDSTGLSGIQADVKTAKDLDANVLTAITSLTIQNSQGIASINDMTTELVLGQIRTIYEDCHPKAVKVGMVNGKETIRQLRDEIIGCQNIVTSPVIMSSDGTWLMDEQSIAALRCYLLPETKLLIIKAQDAELLLNRTIRTDDEMISAAKELHHEGAEWIMLRGSRHLDGRVTALLYGDNYQNFFISYNIEGWQRHGISGASSMAVATFMAHGYDVPSAISKAHEYLHSQIVYRIEDSNGLQIRPKELYNRFISLIAEHHRKEHEVKFYAEALAITPRYLSQITRNIMGKTPKQVIDEYLLEKCKQNLVNTSLSVQEISDYMGFSSQIIFARFIKSKEGLTPRQIRSKN